MSIKDDIRFGLKSGYPACCIAWFVLRQIFFSLFGDRVKDKIFRIERKFKKYRITNHILCPYHLILSSRVWLYNTCRDCKWTQIDNKTSCGKCKSENLGEYEMQWVISKEQFMELKNSAHIKYRNTNMKR